MKSIIKAVIWLLEGVIVGFGAIMPGISGAALCVAFGMYIPLLETVSRPKKNLKLFWKMLAVFFIGVLIGFTALSGLASYLLELSSELVICAFIGFIIGTFPELWHDAGKEERKKSSYSALVIGFVLMLTLLIVLRNIEAVSVGENTGGYFLCGILWGLSLIIPGLSSSTLIMYLGLYQPMLDGIAGFDLRVILPLGIGVVICFLLLSKVINAAYERFGSIISHAVIGVVAATTVMIFPSWQTISEKRLLLLLIIPSGAATSYALTRICSKLKQDKMPDIV